MNRHERRAQRAIMRKQQTQKGWGVAITRQQQSEWTGPVPDDIKRDIAKVVRSIDWQVVGNRSGGMCFFRAMTGWATLGRLDIFAVPTIGGMVYRCGPDEECDVIAYCGPRNLGCKTPRGILAHWFTTVGNEVVDFSVGDWQHDMGIVSDIILSPDAPRLPPAKWTLPAAPEFFWADRSEFEPDRSKFTPELGRAWYTEFSGEPPDIGARAREFLDERWPGIRGHVDECIKFYALHERLFAVREGHTAVRFSQLAQLVGDASLMERAKVNEQLLVLRGKVELTPEVANNLLEEAGLRSMT